MDKSKALYAGLLGGLAMTALMLVARGLGLTELNTEMALGALFTRQLSQATWLIGLLAHLVVSAAIGLLYAAAFEYLNHKAGAGLGGVYGLVHGVVSGLALGFMPLLHPTMPSVVPAPGLFAINFGITTALWFVTLHFVYGAVMGGIYGPVETRNPSHHLAIS